MRKSFYTSQDLPNKPTWSVYSEWTEDEDWDEGSPIDGSQEWVCSAVDEATANDISQLLYKEAKEAWMDSVRTI